MIGLNKESQTLAIGTIPQQWRAFIVYCQNMGHGEIERLKIQDGVPVLAEVTREKVKFS